MLISSYIDGQQKTEPSSTMVTEYSNHDSTKEAFRHSVASTSTTVTSASTSTQRLSITSSSEEENCPQQSMTANNNSSKDTMSDSYSDILDNSISCVSVKQALEHATCSDWICKYETPSFTFAKSWKKRLCILADKVVYIFKSAKSSQPPKEEFVLTENTFVFVTEEFKKGYVIELRKPYYKWYIRCGSVEQMKRWLELMKKVVGCIKVGYKGQLNPSVLSNIKLTDDYKIISFIQDTKSTRHQSLPNPELNGTFPVVMNRRSLGSPPFFPVTQRQSLAEISDWEATIPPQLPPPRCKLPPLPLPTVSE